jgi:hypothetical protein
MNSVEPQLNRACEVLNNLVGPFATIAMIALTFGLICLCVGLTILVLWRSFSFGFRFTVLKAWVQLRTYLTKYFNRLRQYGLTKVSSRNAVAAGFVVWAGVALAFAFRERLFEGLLATAILLLVLYAWGWLKRGPSARFFKFTRGFMEPTLAFALPAFIAKSGDFVFKFVVTTIRTVL